MRVSILQIPTRNESGEGHNSLRHEMRGIRKPSLRARIQVASPLHNQRTIPDRRTGQNPNRLVSIRPSTSRQRSVLERHAHVVRNHRVQSERLVHDVLKVLHVLEVLVCGLFGGADGGEDFLAQFGGDAGGEGEVVDGPGESAGGGVAACEEDRDELVAEHLAVACVACDGVEEGVARVVGVFLGEFLGGEGKGAVDVVVDEFVNGFDARVESHAVARNGPVQWANARDDGLHALRVVEGVGEAGLWFVEGVDAGAEEEVCCCVESVAEHHV